MLSVPSEMSNVKCQGISMSNVKCYGISMSNVKGISMSNVKGISMSNVKCQVSWHINVEFQIIMSWQRQSMSKVKCHILNIKCRMPNQ